MKLTSKTIKDDEILDFADKVRALTVRALGEEDSFPPSHPLTIQAKRILAQLINASRIYGSEG